MSKVQKKVVKKSTKPKDPVNEVKKAKLKKVDPKITKLKDDLNKKFGDNTVTIGFTNDFGITLGEVERIPTGSLSLDVSLGGGLPLGRYISISGQFSSTKTTQSAHIVREAQKYGLTCAWLDLEGTSTPEYFKRIGVDADNLIYTRPDGMEEALETLVQLQKSGLVHLAVLDSIASLVPTKETEVEMGESFRMGLVPTMLGSYFRKYQSLNNRLEREGNKPFTLIGINQIREKIGAYGNPEYTPGGRAKDFASSIDIRLKRGDQLKEGKGDKATVVGQTIKYLITKNKTYKNLQTGEFDFYSTENNAGVEPFYNDRCLEIIQQGMLWGIIETAGAWMYYKDEKYQGASKLIKALKEDPKIIEDIYQEVLNKIRNEKV